MNKILYIKTKDKNYFTLGLFMDNKFYIKKFFVKTGEMSKKILSKIQDFIANKKILLKDIDLIVVYQGPGSYTSLRVGILTANTLAYSLNIAIYAIRKNDRFKTYLAHKKVLIKTKKKFSKPVKAYYQQVV